MRMDNRQTSDDDTEARKWAAVLFTLWSICFTGGLFLFLFLNMFGGGMLMIVSTLSCCIPGCKICFKKRRSSIGPNNMHEIAFHVNQSSSQSNQEEHLPSPHPIEIEKEHEKSHTHYTKEKSVYSEKGSIPEEYLDPLTKTIMADPITTLDGSTFERISIQKWFKKHPNKMINPITKKPLYDRTLIPNHSLRQAIEFYKTEQQVLNISQEKISSKSIISDVESDKETFNSEDESSSSPRDRPT